MDKYKVVDAEQLDAELTNLANKIREKGGTTEELDFYKGDFTNAVGTIDTSKEEQEKVVDITENGTTVVTPDEGMTLSGVTVNVEIEQSGGEPFPENALLAFTDYDGTGLPRTLIYNCPDTYTQEKLFYSNVSHNGFWSTVIKHIILPNHVTTISKLSFGGLSYLETLSNWDYITRIEDTAFSLNNGTYDKGNKLQHTYLPPNLTYIGSSAFRRNVEKIASELPDTLTYIGDGAFIYGGSSSKPFTFTKLPPNLTYIGNDAFMAYFIFETLDIPATVDYIGTRAFEGSYHKTSLTEVKFRGTPTTLGNTAFVNNTALTNIYVPWSEDNILNTNAPWGATNATVWYNVTYDENGNPLDKDGKLIVAEV